MRPTLHAGVPVALVPLSQCDESTLSPPERALVESARSDRRRQELTAGRIAARATLEALRPLPSPLPDVLADPSGRPVCVPDVGVFVSIAHDEGMAAAAVARAPIGLDVLRLDRADQADRVVRARIDTGRATGLLRQVDAPWSDGLVLWTAWEALGKLSGEGVLGEAMLTRLEPEPHGHALVARTRDAELRWWIEGGFAVCLALGRAPYFTTASE